MAQDAVGLAGGHEPLERAVHGVAQPRPVLGDGGAVQPRLVLRVGGELEVRVGPHAVRELLGGRVVAQDGDGTAGAQLEQRLGVGGQLVDVARQVAQSGARG